MKFLADIEVDEGIKDKNGGLGADGQILSSTGSEVEWIDAGGTIGGSIADNQIAVGAATSNTVEGSSALSFTGSTTQRFIVGDGAASPSIFIDQLLGQSGAISFRVRTTGVSTQTESEIRLDTNKFLQINSSQKVVLDGETSGVVITGTGQITMKEFANSTGPTQTAGFGTLWVDPNSGSPNKLYYTDDVGTDYDLTAGGGGGSIGGSIAATQVAFGATTDDEIDGNSTFTFVKNGSTGSAASTLLEVGDGDSSNNTSTGSVFITAKQVDDSTSRARFQLYSGGDLRGYLQCSGTSTDVALLSVNNLVLSGGAKVTIDGGSTSDIVIASASGSKVGIGVADPKSKLQVNGGVQIANDTDGPSADKVGTFKYYTATIGSFDYSYVDMCMQTDTATYEWVNILTNRWAN